MLTNIRELDRTLALMHELRRRMDSAWTDFDAGWPYAQAAPEVWPRINVFDTGTDLVLKADVPGMSEKDLQITLDRETLSLAGERRIEAPEGYSVHRQERSSVKFSRSLSLPCKVAADRTSAVVKDGVLTLTLAKAPEAQPRQIAVRTQESGGAS